MKIVENIARSRLGRWMPGVRLIQSYELSWLPKDLASGITLGTLMVPVGLAYGEMAGVPLAGLYAGMLPLIAYALFGSSRQLIVGVDATMAALVAVSLSPLAGGDAGRLAVMACLLAVLIGLIYIMGSFLRLGFIADFLAKPVIVGFMHGLALVIAVAQLPNLLGVKGGGETTVDQFVTVCRNLAGTRVTSLCIGAACIAIILSCRRWFPRIPGQIVALIGGILVVNIFRLDQSGVAVIGNIPRGLPHFQIPIPSMQDIQSLLPVAFAAVLLGFSDTVVIAGGFASRNHYRIDANQEMLALGLANIAAGLTQGMPVNGSSSRTAAAESSGSRTQVTSMVAAMMVAAVMLFLTDLLYSLPKAALSGILIAAAWNLCNFREFQRLWHFRGVGLLGALLTMAGVIGIGIKEGIGIGVLYCFILLLRALAVPNDAMLGQVGPDDFRDVKRCPDARAIPGVVVYRFSGPLLFFNCGMFRKRIEEVVERSVEPLHGFILDASAIFEVDYVACEVLSEFHGKLHAHGTRLMIANLREDVQDRLVRGWEVATTGYGVFFESMGAAVRDLRI
ncbi:MAG: SulP family inorganic anion transporter [Deltaproteobacteria bacterium]|nr:SulP family inorganic anion transporter [Deltaproteobacteria bacterium]